MMTRRNILFLFVLALFVCGAWTPALGYYNGSPSAPKGFYKTVSAAEPLTVGQYVIIPVPAAVRDLVYGRGWLKDGTPMLKQVGAVEGDRVTITDAGIYINDRYFGPVFTEDSEGLPVPQLRGSFVILPGEFLPLNPYERSFDGRYFGPVPIASVENAVEPLWTY